MKKLKLSSRFQVIFALIAIVGITFSLFSYFPNFAEAQNNNTNYKLLAPLPIGDSVKNAPETEIDFVKYIGGMFKLAVAAAGVLAVFMIVWGGFTYVTTDSFSGKSEGRGYITNALLGLALTLLPWLFLYTINPELVSLRSIFTSTPPAEPQSSLDQSGNTLTPYTGSSGSNTNNVVNPVTPPPEVPDTSLPPDAFSREPNAPNPSASRVIWSPGDKPFGGSNPFSR